MERLNLAKLMLNWTRSS